MLRPCSPIPAHISSAQQALRSSTPQPPGKLEVLQPPRETYGEMLASEGRKLTDRLSGEEEADGNQGVGGVAG